MMRSIVVALGVVFITGCAGDPEIERSRQYISETPDSVVMSGTIDQDEEHYLAVDIPAEATGAHVRLSGVGDADLYTRLGAPPSVQVFDCRPYRDGMEEVCDHPNSHQTLHILVRGWDQTSEYAAEIVWEGIGTSP